MFDSPKQRGYPLWEGTENRSQFEAIKLAISDYPEYPLFMCSKSTLFGRPWCNKKPPWIHDSGRVKNHHNWIRNLLDYVGMRPTSATNALSPRGGTLTATILSSSALHKKVCSRFRFGRLQPARKTASVPLRRAPTPAFCRPPWSIFWSTRPSGLSLRTLG